LTLNQLKAIEKSVTNSIVAAMHGRIQYPEGVTKQPAHCDIDHSQSGTRSNPELTGIFRADRMG